MLALKMDQVTQQNAAMVEEATAASVALNDEALSLQQLVTRFHVSASTGDRVRSNEMQAQGRAGNGGANSTRFLRVAGRRDVVTWEEF
ncbi:hypothetical protein [Sinorhizobium meliloti]|uniref:hypothetical protein n=1 Tax=Rhizobium meliloti TaxID=382 RepID=UPI003F18419E